LVLIFALIIATFVSYSAYAQASISISTDKKFYNSGDIITISGFTGSYIPDTPVAIIIRNPYGTVIDAAQVNVGNDMFYSTTVNTGGGLWTTAGTYTVEAHYGNKNIMNNTYFNYNIKQPLNTTNAANKVPNTTANPPGGSYTTEQQVTLTSDRPATIYYTTDGSDPTDSSTHDSSPITGISITSTTVLKFYAVDVLGHKELIKMEIYEIKPPIPIVAIVVSGTTVAAAVGGTLVALNTPKPIPQPHIPPNSILTVRPSVRVKITVR
jgi:hypothetical protein